MQARSCFIHLVKHNGKKINFKMDIICVRLIILKFLYYIVVM
jgi:hypothetical protein